MTTTVMTNQSALLCCRSSLKVVTDLQAGLGARHGAGHVRMIRIQLAQRVLTA